MTQAMHALPCAIHESTRRLNHCPVCAACLSEIRSRPHAREADPCGYGGRRGWINSPKRTVNRDWRKSFGDNIARMKSKRPR